MELRIGPGGFVLEKRQGAMSLSRPIRFQQLLSILGPSTVLEYGLLPPNTRWISRHSDGSIHLIIEVPKAKYRIHVKHDAIIDKGSEHFIDDVPLPAMAFGIKLRPGRTYYSPDKVKVVALGGNGLVSLDEPVFDCPLPNIYHGTHNVCWHTASLHTLTYKTVSSSEDIVSRFFRSSFNDHLFAPSRLSKEFKWTDIPDFRYVEKYFKKLAQSGEFLTQWLSPTKDTVRTVLC